MRFYADLHVRPERTALDRHLVDLDRWVLAAAKKGVSLLGTGGALDSAWRAHARELLVAVDGGLFELQTDARARVETGLPWPEALPRLVLSDEITLRYRADGKKRRADFILWFADFASAEAAAKLCSRKRALTPIELYEETQHIDGVFVMPADVFDARKGLFGWKHGLAPTDAYALELRPWLKVFDRGRAARPSDCERWSYFDGLAQVTMSYASMPEALGENVILLDGACEFQSIRAALESGERIIETVGTVQEASDNALDGHRRCKVALAPEESRKHRGICPACRRPLTLGVRHRMELYADRPASKNESPPFRPIVPLRHILAEVFHTTESSLAQRHERLLSRLGPELSILLHAPIEAIATEAGAHVSEGIRRLREGLYTVRPGSDGRAGTVSLFVGAELDERRHPRLPFAPNQAPAPRRGACPHLSGLDREQKQAVVDNQNHVLVLAAAGTGKTKTLARKIAHAIACEGVPPERCLTLCASPRAKKDLERRLAALVPTAAHAVVIRTSEELANELATEIADEPARAALIALERDAALQQDINARYRFIAIDDWQHFGPLEHALLRYLVGKEARLWAAGDVEQTLGQRAADWDGARSFQNDFSPVEVMHFSTQYRTTQPIHTTFVELPNGAAEADHIATAIARLQSAGTAFGDIAILFRAPAQGSLLRKALAKKNIPYQCRSHLMMLDNPLVLAIVREARSLPDELELEQRLEVAAAAVSGRENTLEVRDALELLALIAKDQKDLGDIARRAAHTTELETWDPDANRVSLLTLHAAQGLEFEVVFIAGCDEGILPHSEGDLQSERRLFHVAMTRARSNLRLTSARRRLWRGHIRDFTVSRFVAELRAQAHADKQSSPAEPSPEQLPLF
jgi:PHP family Zn ribbon phosphoesterase